MTWVGLVTLESPDIPAELWRGWVAGLNCDFCGKPAAKWVPTNTGTLTWHPRCRGCFERIWGGPAIGWDLDKVIPIDVRPPQGMLVLKDDPF